MKEVKVRYVLRNDGPIDLRVVQLHSSSIDSHRFRKNVEDDEGRLLTVLDSRLSFLAIGKAFNLLLQQIKIFHPLLATDLRDLAEQGHYAIHQLALGNQEWPKAERHSFLGRVEELLDFILNDGPRSTDDILASPMERVYSALELALDGVPPLLILLHPDSFLIGSKKNDDVGRKRVILKHFASDVQYLQFPEEMPGPNYPAWAKGLNQEDGIKKIGGAIRSHGFWSIIFSLMWRAPLRSLSLALATTYTVLVALYLSSTQFLRFSWEYLFARTFHRRLVVDRPPESRSFHLRIHVPDGLELKKLRWPPLSLAIRPTGPMEWNVDQAVLPYMLNKIGWWPKLKLPPHDPNKLNKIQGNNFILRRGPTADVVFGASEQRHWDVMAQRAIERFTERWIQAALWMRLAVPVWWQFPPTRVAKRMSQRTWVRTRMVLPWRAQIMAITLYIFSVGALIASQNYWEQVLNLVEGREEVVIALLALLAALGTQIFLSLGKEARRVVGARLVIPLIIASWFTAALLFSLAGRANAVNQTCIC